jgi:rhodanese-related sulfurtransferase
MKKSLLASIGALAIALLISACSSGSDVAKKDAAGFLEVANQSGVVIIDVRTPAEFAEGHLPNALNIDFQSGNFEQEIESLDKSVTYAVYCRSGNRSSKATAIMADAGFTSIYDLDGGLSDLQAAGAQVGTN